jgi:hypothetical protein
MIGEVDLCTKQAWYYTSEAMSGGNDGQLVANLDVL